MPIPDCGQAAEAVADCSALKADVPKQRKSLLKVPLSLSKLKSLLKVVSMAELAEFRMTKVFGLLSRSRTNMKSIPIQQTCFCIQFQMTLWIHHASSIVDVCWYLLMCLWIATSCRFSGVQIAREPIVVGSRRFPTFGHLKSLQWHGDMTLFKVIEKKPHMYLVLIFHDISVFSDFHCWKYSIIQIDLSMVIFEVSLLPGWLGEWSASRCATSRAHGPAWTLRNPKDENRWYE